MEDQELIKDFLIESNENLGRLDQEMVELEKRPKDAALLASIFRTIHTIKGTCGFLGFSILERITHRGENILSQVRNFERDLTPELVSLILEMVDAIKTELRAVELTFQESGNEYPELTHRLELAAAGSPAPSPASAASVPTPPAPPTIQHPLAEAPPEPSADTTPPPAELEVSSPKLTVADSTIRVDVGLLDRLMNLVGELVLARNQILQFSTRLEDAAFTATSQRLNLITTQLQEGVMKTRMQPIGVVWNKLPRVVRDLSNACGKQIEIEMDGAETELDKSIIEAIKDPLTHLVRNCCDHGIEMPDARLKTGKSANGTLSLRAFHEGGQVNIEISDDGRGIDPERIRQKALQKGLIRPEQAQRMNDREAINLIFLPGFSTAEKVTNISGRGVGMDVVKTNIEKIGGTVDISSNPGAGSTVKLKIPLTLAIIPGLVVVSGTERFVIPQVSLLELVRLEGDAARKQIERIHGVPVYRRRGNLLPIAYLREVLKMGPARQEQESDVINIVILQAEDRQFGLVVDGIHDTQEIVVKPLGKQLKGLACYAGATIMGDGKVALILDVVGLGLKSGVLNELRSSRLDTTILESSADDRQSLLLFRSGRFERIAVPLSLVARLEEFPRDKIERAGGQDVVQYRDQILPLIPLVNYLDGGYGDAQQQDPAQVIVFSDGERRIGLLVDQIVDIVEDSVHAKQRANHRGLMGSAVVGNHVTDFLDLHSVIEQAGDGWFSGQSSKQHPATVLVAEQSHFARGLVRNALEMAGHRVVEAGHVNEALEKATRHRIDLVATSLDLSGGGGTALLEQLRKRAGMEHIPAVALINGGDDAGLAEARGRFDEMLGKFDREAMVRSIERLAAALSRADAKPGALAHR